MNEFAYKSCGHHLGGKSLGKVLSVILVYTRNSKKNFEIVLFGFLKSHKFIVDFSVLE